VILPLCAGLVVAPVFGRFTRIVVDIDAGAAGGA
jgi:hypothetical protein